jgi:hypothetical protein
MIRLRYITLLISLATVVANSQVSPGKSISINVSASLVSDSPVDLMTLNDLIISTDINSEKEIYISPISNPDAGLLRARCRPNSQARMTYLINEVVHDVNGADIISLVYEMSAWPTRVQRASTLINNGEFILNFGSDGLYYLWLGVRVKMDKSMPGEYTGQFTVEIEYI